MGSLDTWTSGNPAGSEEQVVPSLLEFFDPVRKADLLVR